MPSFSQMPLGEFVELAASNSPTPGGGGIAALAGALGTAMASMATNFTIGKPRFVQHEEEMQDILAKLGVLTEEFLDAIDADAAAFTRITDAYGLPKATDEEKAKRREAISDAVFAAMQVPLSLLRKCVKAAELLPSLAGAGNPNLLSDVEVAGIMIEAASRAAMTNVMVNSRQLRSEEARIAEREAVEISKLVIATTSMVTDIIARRSGAV